VKVWSLESGPFQSDEAEKEGHSDNIIGQSRHAKGQKLHDPMKGEGRERRKKQLSSPGSLLPLVRAWWKTKKKLFVTYDEMRDGAKEGPWNFSMDPSEEENSFSS